MRFGRKKKEEKIPLPSLYTTPSRLFMRSVHFWGCPVVCLGYTKANPKESAYKKKKIPNGSVFVRQLEANWSVFLFVFLFVLFCLFVCLFLK